MGLLKKLILVSGLIESLIFYEGSCFILIHICFYAISSFFLWWVTDDVIWVNRLEIYRYKQKWLVDM
jgi:hypothetical protein